MLVLLGGVLLERAHAVGEGGARVWGRRTSASGFAPGAAVHAAHEAPAVIGERERGLAVAAVDEADDLEELGVLRDEDENPPRREEAAPGEPDPRPRRQRSP